MDATGRKAMPFEREYVSVPLRLCTFTAGTLYRIQSELSRRLKAQQKGPSISKKPDQGKA